MLFVLENKKKWNFYFFKEKNTGLPLSNETCLSEYTQLDCNSK